MFINADAGSFWRQGVLAILISGVAAWFACHNYFIQDDAYISYVYAGHFAHGDGLVWYPGSTEFGYTNFLYTLLIGIGIFLRLDPEWVSAGINGAAYAVSLYIAFRLTLRLSSSYLAAAGAALALATHHSFSAYASGGLETMAVTALILAFYHRLLSHLEQASVTIDWPLALIAAAALLMRLDSSLLLFPGYVYLAIPILRCRNIYGPEAKNWLIAAAVPLAAILCLLAGCYAYYGYLLPTSFYLKIPGDNVMVKVGINYLTKYTVFQKGIPVLLLAITANNICFCLYEKISRLRFCFCAALAASLLLWLLYVIYVGGDFMEFRIIVPVLPLLYILAFATSALCFRKAVHFKLFLLLTVSVLANLGQAFSFQGPGEDGIETTGALYGWMNRPDFNWRIAGQGLHTLFYSGRPDDVKIATGPAGAIPYYSGLPAVDLLGLNSRGVLNDGFPIGLRPGHRIGATDHFVESQRVNINLVFPQALCERNGLLEWVPMPVIPYPQTQTILLPLGNHCYLVADYRLAHPKIEELLSERVILRYMDVRRRTRCPPWLCLNK